MKYSFNWHDKSDKKMSGSETWQVFGVWVTISCNWAKGEVYQYSGHIWAPFHDWLKRGTLGPPTHARLSSELEFHPQNIWMEHTGRSASA